MNIFIVQAILTLVYGLSVDIRKGRCEDTPYDICRSNGKVGVVATSLNVYYLMSMLKNNNINNAYVYGWNDQYLPMVLYANGTLAPYDPYTNVSEYAFCVADCPCPRDNVVASSSGYSSGKAGHCTKKCSEPNCKFVYPSQDSTHRPSKPTIGPDMNDDSCSSDESPSSRRLGCPTFVKQIEKCHKEKKKCDTGKPFFKRELISGFKTFTYKQTHKKKFVLKSLEESNTLKEEKYFIDKKNSNCDNSALPKILCSPDLLKKIHHYLYCKFNEPICLYVNDCNEIFVFVCEQLFKVEMKEKHHKKKYVLKKLSKKAVKKLIRKGLYGVNFARDD